MTKSIVPSATHTPRRVFVTRLIAGGSVLPLLSSFASAKPGDGQGRQAKAKQRQGGRPDPAQMAARLLTEFDRDGDGALNATELAAALVALHERRPGGRGQGNRARQGRPRQPRNE